jgi:Rieske Fe-S protein
MSSEEQERFEDYLELERFIAEIQAGHTAYPPEELTPTQARVYRMAMLFHAATPGVSEPTTEFATRLRTNLELEVEALQQAPTPVETPPAPVIPLLPGASKPKRHLPRRWLLTGGASVAASLMVGAGVVHGIDMTMLSGPEVKITADSPMDWFRVTTLAEMGNQAVKFKVEDPGGALTLTGYVVRSDEASRDNDPSDSNTIQKGEVIAMSAACTHKGCIVEWSDSDRKFHCPCHGGVFNGSGGIDKATSALYLNRLPLLEVKIIQSTGEIYVRMPAS